VSATSNVAAQLHALSLHLGQRREQLLRQWREAVRRDPELAATASLPRGELNDHIPKILEDFEHRLRADHALQAMHVDLQQRRDAAEHGSHRWQQGYDIRETLREWGHLQSVIARELDAYAAAHPHSEYPVTRAAREILEALCMEGIRESASRYVRLQQCEAASRVRDLEASLSALQALENERAAVLRDAAHDLRGSVSMIASASALLATPAAQQPQPEQFHDLLERCVRPMSALLTDLVELARLEAGQDPPRIEAFDASQRVREFCESLRPMATDTNLFLKYEGPERLPVQGDALKLQRIIQCLLLNALKTTEHGGILVSWSVDPRQPPRQWTLSVSGAGKARDTGSDNPLQQALKSTTEQVHAPRLRSVGPPAAVAGPNAAAARRPAGEAPPALASGEGVRLSLIKRLCEALHATLQLETFPQGGTTIRIAFPLRYAEAPPLEEASAPVSG
jgi:signal transduction histidine kinase